jgi:hypothetical protein
MQSRLLSLSLRFVLPLALVLGLSAYVVVPLVDDLTLRWFVRDLDTRSQSLASALQDPLLEYVPTKAERKITQLFDRTMQDERLYAIGLCDPHGKLLLDFGRVTRGSEPRKATMISLTIRCKTSSADNSQREYALAA